MASILRFAAHARRFTAISNASRTLSSIKYCLIGHGELQQCNKFRNLEIWSLAARSVSSYNVKSDYQKIDNALNRLDNYAKKTGRITIEAVEQLFNDLKQIGKINPNHSMWAIHCCGKLLSDENLETRTKLATDIWNYLETNECELDISHYNALIKVYFENEYKFDATEFLAKIESKGLTPNRVTYQRLISCYCQQGDVEGAGKILEYMKKEAIPINESVFNALILGHAKTNNMEGARGILDVMKNAKVQPNVDTYAALLYAYAEKGDMENINKVIDEVNSQDLYFSDAHYLDVIYNLARYGHAQYTDEIMKKFRKFIGFNQDVISCILKLINCGQDDVALKLLDQMPAAAKVDGKGTVSGHFLIRQLVRANRSVDKVLKVCRDLIESGKNTKALETATHNALKFGKIEHAIALLKAISEDGFPVRTHYFWPLLVNMKKQNVDESRLFEVLNLMMGYGCPANYATFVDYFYPNVNTDNFDELVIRIQSYGYTSGAIVCPLIDHYITQNKLDKAISILQKFNVRVSGGKLIPPLTWACSRSNANVDTVLDLLQMVNEKHHKDSAIDVYGSFLLNYGRAVMDKPGKIKEMLDAMQSRKLSISPEMKSIIEKRLRLDGNGNLTEILAGMSRDSLDVDMSEIREPREPREMTISEMESMLKDLKNKGLSTKAVLGRLLMAYCRNNNLEKVEGIKAEMDSLDYIYSEGMMCTLMNLYANNDKLEEAKDVLSKIKESNPDVAIDQQKLMNFAAALLRADQTDEALKFLAEQPVNIVAARSDMVAFRILNVAAEKGNVELTQKLFDLIVQRNLCSPNNVILGPLVKVHLLKDDTKGAIEKYLEICKHYHCTPWRNHLFEKLIGSDDADSLQRVMNASADIHGEVNTMFELAFSFLKCGRIREAKKIFETSGLRARHNILNNQSERLIEDGDIATLENLVKVTRDLFDVDRDQMYFYLLRAYNKVNDHVKALDLWTLMQEEDIRPNDRTLILLADILKKNNQPIPFAVPERKIEIDRSSGNTSSLMSALADDDLEKALKIKESYATTNQQLSFNEANILLENLIKNDRLQECVSIITEMDKFDLRLIKTIRYLLLRLSANGDLDSVKGLEKKFSQDQRTRIRFNNALYQTYFNKGDVAAILKVAEEDLKGEKLKPPTGVLISILDRYPDMKEKVEKIAREYSVNGVNSPLNNVWLYYFIKEDYKKAEAIFKESPTFNETLNFKRIIDFAEESGNIAMLKRLLDVVKSTTIPIKASSKIISSLLQVQCAKHELDDAKTTLIAARNSGADEFIPVEVLDKFRTALNVAGKDASFLEKKNESSSSTSESSDSDSDADRKKKTKIA